MTELLAAADSRPDAPAEVATLGPMVRALPHLMRHDLARASALFDEAVPALLAHGSAVPIEHFGLWALLRDRRRRPRRAGPRRPCAAHGDGATGNRAALGYADAIAAGRAGQAQEAATRFAEADADDRAACRGGTGCCGCSRWRPPSSTAGATRCPALRADLAAHEAAGAEDWPARAATCCGPPARRPARAVGPVPRALRARGITAREAEVLALVATGLTNAAGGRAAVPVPAHGRDPRGPAARQDRRRRPSRAAPVGGQTVTIMTWSAQRWCGSGRPLDSAPVVLPPGLVADGHVVVVRPHPDGPVDELADDVRVPGVPVGLGDHVHQDLVQCHLGAIVACERGHGRVRRSPARRWWRRSAPRLDGRGR